jgi:hypothetical protein
MGFPWKKVITGGKLFAQLFLPGVVSKAIDEIEEQVEIMRAGGKSGWSGPEKQNAALQSVLQAVAAYEGVAGADVLNDASVAAAGRKLIDASHAQKVALAEFAEAVRLVKASKNPTTPAPAVE